MTEPVHFQGPSLSGRGGRLYSFNRSWSLCRIFLGYKHDLDKKQSTTDASKVTCQKCLEKMRCQHEWTYLGFCNHGSDKDDDYFKCHKCDWLLHEKTSWTPEQSDWLMEFVLETLDEEDGLDLIHAGFKAYQWSV